MKKVVLASGNDGKLREMQAILADLGIELIPQSALGITEVDETGQSFIENAILKARHATRISAMPALGDDSGLCVDALAGAPGLLSARYAGSHGDAKANVDKLLAELRHVPDAQRHASFHCVVALMRSPIDPMPLVAEGHWRGSILEQRRGNLGFGYDPVFLDRDSGLSAAELDPATKNRISHRARALAHLRELFGTRDTP
ncbi:MAG: RdgB/HAM1 family non-canonical purine NTP pyrophosphatase [Rhodanobacteraceae bacterium]